VNGPLAALQRLRDLGVAEIMDIAQGDRYPLPDRQFLQAASQR
jgi:hypothetical protein